MIMKVVAKFKQGFFRIFGQLIKLQFTNYYCNRKKKWMKRPIFMMCQISESQVEEF